MSRNAQRLAKNLLRHILSFRYRHSRIDQMGDGEHFLLQVCALEYPVMGYVLYSIK